ncbi:MAG TPA: response regulator [Acidimicrobiales bacterium]|nr:response regulator [Acidimicrobiales bacterium]
MSAPEAAVGGPASAGTVLVVDDDEVLRAAVEHALRRAGFEVLSADDGGQALATLAEVLPDVVVTDVNMPEVDGFELARRIRASADLRRLPLIFMTTRDETTDVVTGLQLGADDYVVKPLQLAELVARVQAKVARRPVPVELLEHDPRSAALTRARFGADAERERARAVRSGRPCTVAMVELAEPDVLRSRFGGRGVDAVMRQVVDLVADASPLASVGRDGGALLLLLPEHDPDEAAAAVDEVARRVVAASLRIGDDRVRVSPAAGVADLVAAPDVATALDRAAVAASAAAVHLDLLTVRWNPTLTAPPKAKARRPLGQRLRTPLQIAATVLLGVVVPFFVYEALGRSGHDISNVAYWVVVVALLVTAASIWLEGLLAMAPEDPPGVPLDRPAASAIIAAYLPNEAATVMETVEAFLAVDYAGPLQVILAYNTPRPLPIEQELVAVARRDPRFVPLRVEGSTSKAQNVNTALAYVTGEFTGVFDADHLPHPRSFDRAWRWLAGGYDVVQGHAVVRNGDASFVARTVAVEFESIYGVSHPGRKRLHDFGIFGGSNGYWRTELLRATRMRGSMLTEDIDSSLRVTEQGHRIASDPLLVSRELAPTEWRALWNQRMRWAQGWFQVSLRHLWPVLRTRHMTLRQKLGALFLLGWREVYPWLSLQMFPIIAYKADAAGGVGHLNWLIPVLVLTSLFTLSVGPGQVVFAYAVAHPSVRARRRWFVLYLLVASVFYTEYKNVIARVAQIKELMGEKAWKVTPRAATGAATATAGNAAPVDGSAEGPAVEVAG